MKLGTIRGIQIKMQLSTLVIVGLVGFYAAIYYLSIAPGPVGILDLVIIGIINGLIILVSILVHELMHSLMAQHYGIKVPEIEFHMFGGVSRMEKEPETPKSEAIISFVGPLSSIIIGVIFLAVLYIPQIYFDTTYPEGVLVTLFYSGLTNVGLGLFNLLPAFPMDGGRVLRAILWNRRGNLLAATETAAKWGRFFGYGMTIFGFFEMLFIGLLGGLWLVIIGMFLASTARQSYGQAVLVYRLSQFRAGDILEKIRTEIPANTTISNAIQNYFSVYRQNYFPVEQNGQIIGLVHLSDIGRIALELRKTRTIADITAKLSDFPTVEDDATGEEVLNKLSSTGKDLPGIVIVNAKRDKHILGFIGEQDLRYALRMSDMNLGQV